MAEPTVGMRVSKETRELADKIAQRVVSAHAPTLPTGSYSVSQGDVVCQALQEFVANHKELGL